MEDRLSPKHIPFDKYDDMGAYHWDQCDRRSRNYNPPLEARYRVLVDKLQGENRVLDVGCGDGYLMSLISALSEDVIGIDTDHSGVRQADRKLKSLRNCRVVQASCYEVPFDDGSFDLVLMTDVFEHLERPDLSIREICRVLTTNGSLMLTTPKWRPDRRWDHRHWKEYRPDELMDILSAHFSLVTLTFFWPIRWSRMYSTRLGWRAIRMWTRYLNNPFLQEGSDAQSYGQIFALCSGPR